MIGHHVMGVSTWRICLIELQLASDTEWRAEASIRTEIELIKLKSYFLVLTPSSDFFCGGHLAC